MKIVIRRGLIHPDIYVVHPVTDDYRDADEWDKLDLHGEGPYKAFQTLLASSPEVIGSEIGNMREGMAMISGGGQYSPPQGSLLAQIISPQAEGIVVYDAMQLNNLEGILQLVKQMRSGDSSITIENKIENSPGEGRGGGRFR